MLFLVRLILHRDARTRGFVRNMWKRSTRGWRSVRKLLSLIHSDLHFSQKVTLFPTVDQSRVSETKYTCCGTHPDFCKYRSDRENRTHLSSLACTSSFVIGRGSQSSSGMFISVPKHACSSILAVTVHARSSIGSLYRIFLLVVFS